MSLSIEVFPKAYSDHEKRLMLIAANATERDNGWSDDMYLMNMFDEIDEILNCDNPVGEIEVLPLELTLDEKKMLLLFT